MRLYLISDNTDTIVGMRLAGIEGVLVHTAEEIQQALLTAMEQEDIGVVLMTEHLVNTCPDLVYDLKLHKKRPLIVEIPDRHGMGRDQNAIARYVREAIGVKI